MSQTSAPVDAVPCDANQGLLPPYTGEKGRCRKCGATFARTRYQPALSARQLLYADDGRPRRGPLPERLERECATCEYQWDEAVLDTTNDTKEAPR